MVVSGVVLLRLHLHQHHRLRRCPSRAPEALHGVVHLPAIWTVARRHAHQRHHGGGDEHNRHGQDAGAQRREDDRIELGRGRLRGGGGGRGAGQEGGLGRPQTPGETRQPR
ncbi:hypothetical protein NP493_1839g00019 [Ridgeia piscesae]|uniref:Uncharacterized protein n=1 Tax=Ridgeia piscesae TaxID=27915 RepID=A0AAD9N737_RIDPI|nr:hypothetical protein NP493_1839g00019 [Ridgeia piscesae]